MNKNGSMMKSSYYHPKPFNKVDIDMYGLGLKIIEAEFYDSKDALMGKYIGKVIGICF